MLYVWQYAESNLTVSYASRVYWVACQSLVMIKLSNIQVETNTMPLRGAGRIVETLSRTGGFSVNVARRRMLETLQYVLQVTKSLDAIKPGGQGHISSVRVRLLHAAVRQKILILAHQRTEYYDVEQFGVPANDLDCIATINSFSAVVIWISLPRQGLRLSEQEVDDYIALWRLVAHYMGCPTNVFSTRQKTKAMMESLIMFEVKPTVSSKILANNILLALDNAPPTYASTGFMAALTRRLNGRQLCDALDIPRATMYYRVLVYGYCIVIIAYACAARLVPSFDEKLIAVWPIFFLSFFLFY